MAHMPSQSRQQEGKQLLKVRMEPILLRELFPVLAAARAEAVRFGELEAETEKQSILLTILQTSSAIVQAEGAEGHMTKAPGKREEAEVQTAAMETPVHPQAIHLQEELAAHMAEDMEAACPARRHQAALQHFMEVEVAVPGIITPGQAQHKSHPARATRAFVISACLRKTRADVIF